MELRAEKLGRDGERQGPRKSIIYVPDNPGSSLIGDRGNPLMGRGVEKENWSG